MSANQYALGIDVGTTSVKVCVFDPKTNSLIAKQSKDTQANVPSDLGSDGDKQDVPKIVSALHNCMSRLPKDVLKQITVIGVCGQMHGVVLWHHTKENPAWDRIEVSGPNPGVKFEVVRSEVSNLYTWQDSRCDLAFLNFLPVPESHVKTSTGHGCATLFWFAKNRPEKIQKYNCSGTIQDFVVALLCNKDNPVMSTQNAASWGYFNATNASWNTTILEAAGFPVHLLPSVVEPKTVVGSLPETWFGIPSGTPVGAALGDFQCSVIATLNSPNEAALNVSTSAQVAFQMNGGFQPEPSPVSKSVNYFPYFDKTYLAVAASLNGGNALAAFVRMLQQWTLELGFSVPQAKVWEKVTELGCRPNAASTVDIVPRLLGERHSPEESATVTNLDLGSLGLGQIFRALCKGVIRNLHSMMPSDQLVQHNISKIIGSGSALTRNKVLQEEVQLWYPLPVEFISGRGACLGAALAMSKREEKFVFEYGAPSFISLLVPEEGLRSSIENLCTKHNRENKLKAFVE